MKMENGTSCQMRDVVGEKEDKHLFIPCMDYFTETEQQSILREEWEFDRNLIHEKYKNMVIAAEKEMISRTL